ncbi:carboxymuconolactone decarboxylase family protein [Micromonospora lupini]|uniref:Alkylhydroperoxidase like protein, AhpD family n=1 Tax=Micromonospora lupini str. Lupac 08 TaxID=1150864 RepID=I0KZS5_9ACTN|nr:carboxymuconolactone decarboxylase family protein [Micromonospora lupini]CCH17072.1 Alkylhydroperoxidase like protein, AhpD family [Micromonospora lupini str. Lupac 08]
MSFTVAGLTRRSTFAHLRHVSGVPPETAPVRVRQVYEQVERDFGLLAPPIALHSAAPGLLAAAWCILRETLLVSGTTSRREREEVAAAVSAANTCPYCVDVHQAAVRGLGGRRTSPPPLPAVLSPELIGVAVDFHYLNRMVNVFLRDSPLAAVPAPLLGGVRSAAARVMGRLAGREAVAGQSLPLLPGTAGTVRRLPDDLRWAAGLPHVAAAMTGAAAVVEDAGQRSVPPAVRQLVRESLVDAAVPGDLAGATQWLDTRLAGLSSADRATGRLAMLVAFASYRVPDSAVAAVRAEGHDDGALLGLAAWAALTAARRHGDALARAYEAAG